MALAGISHLDLAVRSIERSLPFYRGLLEPLGYTRRRKIVGERGEEVWYLSIPDRFDGALGLREARSDAHRAPYERYALGVHHICFNAASRSVVEERHSWLCEQGVVIESAPREYDYTPGYYAVFFHDPDGIKLEVLHRP